jgi:PAS domain-containing protein
VAFWIKIAQSAIKGTIARRGGSIMSRSDDDADPQAAKSPANNWGFGPGVDRVRLMNFVLDYSPDLVAYWRSDLVCLFANQAYAIWFQRPMAEILGVRYEILLGDVVARRNQPFIDGVLSGTPQRFEQLLLSSDRGWVPILTNLVPDIVEGKTVGFICHCTDVSLLKETERALREEAAERQRANRIIRESIDALEEAQRLGQIGSWTWTAASDDVRWSKELYRIMGRDPALPAPTFGQHDTLFAPESWARLRLAVQDAMTFGESYQISLEYVRSDGARGWLEARGEAVRDSDGRIIGLRGTVRRLAAEA